MIDPAESPISVRSTTEHLVPLLVQMGCPPDKCPEMAEHLTRRAQQLAEQTGRTPVEALTHLLRMMREGWAAQGYNPDSLRAL